MNFKLTKEVRRFAVEKCGVAVGASDAEVIRACAKAVADGKVTKAGLEKLCGTTVSTQETIAKTIAFAKEINPHTLQVSLAAPYPGTRLYQQAVENNWIAPNKSMNLVNDKGEQLATISYPHLSTEEIYHGVELFYKSFYFRPSKIWEIVREMLGNWDMLKRRLREGAEFFRFLRAHEV